MVITISNSCKKSWITTNKTSIGASLDYWRYWISPEGTGRACGPLDPISVHFVFHDETESLGFPIHIRIQRWIWSRLNAIPNCIAPRKPICNTSSTNGQRHGHPMLPIDSRGSRCLFSAIIMTIMMIIYENGCGLSRAIPYVTLRNLMLPYGL